MKGGDTIETAQITSLQNVLPDNQAISTVDKKDFLEKLESFLAQEGDTNEQESTLAKRVLTAIEYSENDQVDLDFELEEEEIQALFSPLQFQIIHKENNSPAAEKTSEISVSIESTIEQNTSVNEFDLKPTEDFTEMVDKSGLVSRTPVEDKSVEMDEANKASQVENSVRKMTNENLVHSEEVKVPVPTISNEKVVEVEQTNSATIEQVVENEKNEETFLTQTMTREPSEKLMELENVKEIATKEVFSNFTEVDEVKANQRPVENKDEVESILTNLKPQESHEVEGTSKQEISSDSVENWFRPLPQVPTVEHKVESAPIQISQERWTSQVEQLVVEEVQTAEGNKVTTTHIQLTPEHLGKLKLDLKIENRELKVQIKVEHLETKEWLESQLSLLTNNLATQEISVASIQIEVEPTHSNPFSFDQGQQPSQEDKPFEGKHWKHKGYFEEPTEEKAVSPTIINSARGISLWA